MNDGRKMLNDYSVDYRSARRLSQEDMATLSNSKLGVLILEYRALGLSQVDIDKTAAGMEFNARSTRNAV